MSTAPQIGPDDPQIGGVDVRYYADLLWRGRILVATVGLVGLGLGVLVGYLQTPQYQAGAMLQIDPPTPAFLSVEEAALLAGGSYWQNADYYNTQFKVLRSTTLGAKVLQRLKLKDRPPFKDAPDAASILLSHVTIEPIPESRLVMVQVTHEDAKEAALWANTLAEIFMEESLSSRVEAAKRAYDWLQERLAATQGSMREAREKLFKSYEGQDLFVPEGSVSVTTTTLSKLTGDYIEAQSRRIDLEAVFKQVAEMRRLGQSLDTIPQMAADSTFAGLSGQLTGLNLERSRLKDRYKEAHPEIQRVEAEIVRIRKTKDNRASQIVASLQAEYAQLQKRETELRAAIENERAQAAAQSRRSTELETLKKEAQSATNLYDVLLRKLNETDIAASIRSNNVSLVERAAPPRYPVRPEKKKIAGLALLLGLALGVGLVLGRDYLDNTLKDPEEVERYLHLDLLAAVPKYGESNVHLATEAYQSLRTALIFARKDEAGQVVLVTGTAPQEGKTTTVVNVAKLLASSGEKTVVLDFDLRRAQLHERLGLAREPGLTNFFVMHEDLDMLIQPTRVPNLFALTAGSLPPSPPALLARKNFPDFLDHLRRHFEWVLLDSPPLASVTDALLLARHADMVVLVVQHNKVDKRVIKRSVNAVRRVTSNLLGVVLNVVDVKSQGYHYYYYHHDQAAAAPRAEGRKPGPRPIAAAKP